MASEPAAEPSSFIESLINSRNRDISLLLPFILGLNAANTLQNPGSPPDRIVLINPFTQGMVVIERSSGDSDSESSSLGFDSLLNDLLSSKIGCPPASKASIAAMETVEVAGGEDDRCPICLEEWEAGEKAKRMPCKHRFHGECIEKWLNVHGSCPICRYEMPVDESDDEKKTRSGGERRRREIWVTFTFGGRRRSGESVSSETRSGESDSSTGDQEL